MKKLFGYLLFNLAIICASMEAAEGSKKKGPVIIYNATDEEILWSGHGQKYHSLKPKELLTLKAYSRKVPFSIKSTGEDVAIFDIDLKDLSGDEIMVLEKDVILPGGDILAIPISKKQFDEKYKGQVSEQEQKTEKAKK